jgi:ubiquinone/menaquinone biosynthesis C-methylase UbiE
MKELYHSLSAVYEAMYQSFINYEEEFLVYSSILIGCQSKSVIEIGCGTGNLANSFLKKGFSYTGLDVSEDMLNIAREKFPNVTFLQGDMRQFTLDFKKDSCIITGRTISYLLSNEDVLKTFHSINRNLEMGGIIVFDFIDALQFIPRIKDGEEIIHTAAYQQKNYQRKSIWTLNLKEGFTFNWLSYYSQITENGQLVELGTDNSIIRTFIKEELFIFLTLAGFEVLNCVQRPSYAFETFVVTAKKIE